MTPFERSVPDSGDCPRCPGRAWPLETLGTVPAGQSGHVRRGGSSLTAYDRRDVQVTLPDGYRMFVEELGAGLPVIVLHGGPGMDHSMFRPWLDPLADEFRLLYVDERGQGRSDRVDPATLSLDVFARDVDLLAEALGVGRFALLGHSFGAIVTTWHATNVGTAAAYVISGGADESAAMLADVEASLEAMGERGRPIAESWQQEQHVRTDDELAELMRVQTPVDFE